MASVDASLSVVVSLLSIVRQERLIPSLMHVIDAADTSVSVPKSYLIKAIFSESESLYLSVVELACVRPKSENGPCYCCHTDHCLSQAK